MRGTRRICCQPTPEPWDHPRICGEHLAVMVMLISISGSSPHMRGTRDTSLGCFHIAGIIPAYAGNTRYPMSHGTLHRDHPRICGEHSLTDIEDMGYTGSSPHMRGTRRICCQPTPEPWDHPRICGEHLAVMVMLISISGSSPHMRGTRLPCKLLSVGNGIIPAYAGNTTSMSRSRRSPQDHPRICGEH